MVPITKCSFLQLSLWSLTLASYLGETLAKIGPVGDLIIANAGVSPDGHTRMAALAGGTINGELTTELAIIPVKQGTR